MFKVDFTGTNPELQAIQYSKDGNWQKVAFLLRIVNLRMRLRLNFK
jgi:hypothetical protein